ncbi:hypothetical protein [Kitasatospora purpeofusca]|uniref:hypothetical protein n=1 Tax=Kitasatospora purpeofusca TaxID=67352 RepID=UPI003F4AF491
MTAAGQPSAPAHAPSTPGVRRPARDLLEDLPTGIHGCWLLHNEYDDLDTNEDLNDAQDREDEQTEEHQRRSRDRFAQLVRDAAAAHRDHLV